MVPSIDDFKVGDVVMVTTRGSQLGCITDVFEAIDIVVVRLSDEDFVFVPSHRLKLVQKKVQIVDKEYEDLFV